MADPTPLADINAYTAALATGRACYVVYTAAGRRPRTLSPVSSVTPIAQRLSEGRVVVSHDCGTKAMNHTAVDATEVVPPKGTTAPAASDSAQTAHPPSKAVGPCQQCAGPIAPGEPYWGVENLLPEGDYFQHTRCL
jgi:hypothetical protein